MPGLVTVLSTYDQLAIAAAESILGGAGIQYRVWNRDVDMPAHAASSGYVPTEVMVDERDADTAAELLSGMTGLAAGASAIGPRAQRAKRLFSYVAIGFTLLYLLISLLSRL